MVYDLIASTTSKLLWESQISNRFLHKIFTCFAGDKQSSMGDGPMPDEVEGWSTSKILQSSIFTLKGSSNL